MIHQLLPCICGSSRGQTNTFVAYREDATIVALYGGDTAGYKIEFDIKYNGIGQRVHLT